MKKLAFLFAAVVAVSFASCGQKAEKAEVTETPECEVVEEACACDSCGNDSICADSACACPVAE